MNFNNLKKHIWTFVFSCTLCFVPVLAHGQESFPGIDNFIPPSPNASELVKGVQTPVSYYTGTPEVIIPLWTMKGRSMEMPIQLFYHASGIKVEELAGWVGLGWSLEANGVISRSVRGMADDLPGGYFTNKGNQLMRIEKNPEELAQWSIPGGDEEEKIEYLRNVGEQLIDTEADVFHFSVNGISGTFYFDVGGNIVLQSSRNLKIVVETGESREFDRWILVDEHGTVYEFGTPDATERTAHYSNTNGLSRSWGSAWFLKSIRTANYEDAFTFEYSEYDQTVRYSLPHRKNSWSDPNWEEVYKFQEHVIEGKFLQKIKYPRGSVTFRTSTLLLNPPVIIRGMTEMSIHYGDLDSLFKSFRFHYSFFPSTGCATEFDYLPPCRRLRLDKIEEISGEGNEIPPPFLFFYNTTPLPPRGSFSQDFWGYYNSAQNNHLVPEWRLKNHHQPPDLFSLTDTIVSHDIQDLWMISTYLPNREAKIWTYSGANRNPNENAMKAGLLNKIIYPSGAITIFDYESHRFGYYCVPQPTKSVVLDAEYKDRFSNFEKQMSINIPFDQNIGLLSLFYIIEGGVKDVEQGELDPSDSSSILLIGPLSSDAEIDTVYEYSFLKSKEEGPNWVVKHQIWLPKGRYIMVSRAHEEGDLTRVICEYSPFQKDQVVKIHSKEFESVSVQTADGFYDDGKSSYQFVFFSIDSLDDPTIDLYYQFSSAIHPELISSQDPELPYSQIRILKLGNDTIPVFEKNYSGASSLSWNENNDMWELIGSHLEYLSPGQYKLEFIPRMESEFGHIGARYRKLTRIQNEGMAGGVRIKRIIQMDNVSDTLGISSFRYILSDHGVERSSGVLMSLPAYYDMPEELFFLSDGSLNKDYLPLTVYSSGKSLTGVTSGTHIGYKQVEVTEQGSGSTIYKFITADDYPDITSTHFPYPPPVSYDWKRGFVREISMYTQNGILRHQKQITYNTLEDTLHLNYLPSLKVVQVYPDNPMAWAFQKYYHAVGWHHLVEEQETRFDLNGARPLQKTWSYHYDPYNLQLSAKTLITSNQPDKIETYIYPGEGLLSLEVENRLLDKHMIGTIIRNETRKGDIKVKGEIIHYGIFHDSLVLPKSVDILADTFYFETVHFDAYDARGNLLQMHKNDGVYKSLNWDQAGLYPIASIMNSDYRDNIADYGEDIQIERYENHPFNGMLTHLNVSGVKTSYHYDGLGRLSQVKNDDGYIIQQYSYNYKKYLGDTSRLYYEADNIFFSDPPDYIRATSGTLTASCETQLYVEGGTLGTNAKWMWYRDQCGINPIGEGRSISIYPDETTTYFVRAEGLANNTACLSKLINVGEPQFKDVPDTLFFDSKGTVGIPFKQRIYYTGCDPMSVHEEIPWLNTQMESELILQVDCFENLDLEPRYGTVTLLSGRTDTVFYIFQHGAMELDIILESSQRFAMPGDEISISCQVVSGFPPFDIIWDQKMEPNGTWTNLATETFVDTRSGTISFLTPSIDFSVRCRVISGSQMAEGIVMVRIVE